MNRLLSVFLLLLAAGAAVAQDDPNISRVAVAGLPDGARVARYAVVQTESGNALVTEIETADGTNAFYVYDYIDDVLTARSVGPRSIPADLSVPPVGAPVTRDLDVPGDRFWPVAGFAGSDRNEQLLSAPPLGELRYALVGESPWQLSPPPDHPLAVRRVTIATDGTVLGECLIEPNITAAVDRMTTGGAWWVRPFGEPHLLVGLLHQGPGDDRREGLRLYNERHELVATAEPVIDVDTNAVPELVQADLSGNGSDELLFFPTAVGSDEPLVVYRFERRVGGRRILAFNLCSVRMNGADVVRLQRALEGRGFSVGRHGLDGWYGPDTRAAVIRFQRAAELPVTGVVDDAVWDLLGL